jgi:two-component system osmolarity sensor histidine kinase EnvZ
MLPQSGVVRAEDLRQDIDDMVGDVVEMENLIGTYLAFVRGEGMEKIEDVSLRPFLKEIVAAAARAGGREVRLEVSPGLVVPMRPDAMRGP